jgi:hypothetical protein
VFVREFVDHPCLDHQKPNRERLDIHRTQTTFNNSENSKAGQYENFQKNIRLDQSASTCRYR